MLVRTVFLAGFLLLASAYRAAGDFPVYSQSVVKTEQLEKPVRLFVMEPPSYRLDPERRFPVLYFLHDGFGNENVLKRHGIAANLFTMMKEGQLPEFLLVVPRGKKSWFVDSYDGKIRYGTFLAQDLIPHVDRTYRTLPASEARAVSGISMGGFGALRWALSQPGVFAAAGGLSAAIQPLSHEGIERLPFFVRWPMKRVFGRTEEESVVKKRDIYKMLEERPELARLAPKVFVYCGTEDHYKLSEVVPTFCDFLRTRHIACEERVEPGGHDWDYWKRSYPEMVKALTKGFWAFSERRVGGPPGTTRLSMCDQGKRGGEVIGSVWGGWY